MKRKNSDIKWRRAKPIQLISIKTKEEYETLITQMNKSSPQRAYVREKFSQFIKAKKAQLNSTMDITEIRLFMNKQGWISEDKIIQDNYTIVFTREDWHGIQVPNIRFSACTSNRKEMQSTVYELAKTCLSSWDAFVDAVPYQKEDGTIEQSLPLTKWYMIKKQRIG